MESTGFNRYGMWAFWKRLVNSFGNGLFWEKLRRRLWRWGTLERARRRIVFRRRPVERDKVLFACFTGNCSCNPKAVARALARRRPDVDIVWLMDEKSWGATGGRPDTGRAVRRWTRQAYVELATAKVLVENTHMLVTKGNPPKRPGQFYVNTWHGSLGIKRIDVDWNNADDFRRANVEALDAIPTNSDFEEEVFASSPLAPAPRFRIGHPRNDVFFLPETDKAAIRRKVRAALGTGEDVKIALFAPTFRDNALAEGACIYDFAAWKAALERRFGGIWTVAMRLHPMDAIALSESLVSLPAGVVNATDYADIQELLVAADAGITDYSSWIYDFLLGGAPGFIFAPDRAAYDHTRGFYYPLESTPFPIAETNGEMCANIEAFDAGKYARDVAAFIAGKGCMEDGKASDRMVDMIEKWIGGAE